MLLRYITSGLINGVSANDSGRDERATVATRVVERSINLFLKSAPNRDQPETAPEGLFQCTQDVVYPFFRVTEQHLGVFAEEQWVLHTRIT